jgi:cytochrome c
LIKQSEEIMKITFTAATTAAIAFLAAPAFADGHAASGDAEAGEAVFAKQCVACHVVVDGAGETLAGRKARTGPNLYNVAGTQAGTVDGFRYGKSIVAAGADQDLKWVEANFVSYVQDPTGFLKEFTGDSKARSKMSFKVRKEEDAINVYAYLASLAPAE